LKKAGNGGRIVSRGKKKMKSEITAIDALCLAYAKGFVKKVTLDSVLINALYGTKETKYSVHCVTMKDISEEDLSKDRIEENGCLVIRFGYVMREPKTEIDLLIDRKTHVLKLVRPNPGFGWGWDEVENSVVEYLRKQIKKRNLFIQTGYNGQEFPIK
jgi:hypothetical protein